MRVLLAILGLNLVVFGMFVWRGYGPTKLIRRPTSTRDYGRNTNFDVS